MSVSGLGPVPPPSEPRSSSLGPALENYAKLLAHPTPQNLEEIAQKTVELDKLAQSVMHAASPPIRAVASDLERLLQAPLNKEISILTASKHYPENPAELSDLIQELCHNELALGLMCNELTLLSGSIKGS